MSKATTRLFLAAVCMLASCYRVYVPPSDGDVAHLRIVDGTGAGLSPYSAWIATFQEAEECEGRYFIQGPPTGMRETAVTTDFEKIPAGRNVALSLIVTPFAPMTTKNTPACAPTLQFAVERGRYYLLTLTFDDKLCYLSLRSAASPTMQNAREETFEKMTYSASLWGESSSWCTPSAEAAWPIEGHGPLVNQ